MIFNQQSFIPLSRLASRFDLPEPYLKELAGKSLIPSLNVNGRLRFDIEAVRHALNELAKKGVSNNAR